jgi:ABC-2 type transport system permease protein
MRAVYVLTLRQLSGRGRLAIMTVLAALPVLMTLVMMRAESAPQVGDYETVVLSGMLAGSIVPLIVLALAAPAFANELEDRTLANLALAPLPRWQIAVPKLLAILTLAVPFIAASAALTAHAAYVADPRATLAVTGAILVAVAMYAAAFLFLGLVTTQAIGVGLLYIVVWEGLFAGFVAGVRLLSIRYNSMALMHGLDERRFDVSGQPSMLVASIASLAVFAVFVWLTVRRLRRMDVP